MKFLSYFCIISVLLLYGHTNAVAQKNLSPNQYINQLLKDKNSLGVRVPGWVIRITGKVAAASEDLEMEEKEMIKQLSKNIKNIRVLFNVKSPDTFIEELSGLHSFFDEHSYDALAEVRSDGSDVRFWTMQDGNTIKNIVVSVINKDKESVFINIKTKMDIEDLKRKKFFSKLHSI